MEENKSNPLRDKCIICGESRIIQRCHIIPKRLIHRNGVNKDLYDFEGRNTIILCPTHHKLFDTWKMNDKELDIIDPYIKAILNDFLRIGDDFKDFQPCQQVRVVKNYESWWNKFKNIYSKRWLKMEDQQN